MKNKKIFAVICAVLAAVFYALNTPCSKLLLADVPPTFLAAFLYIGAGVGVGILYLFQIRKEAPDMRLTKNDLPYTIGMIVLDILAPILLMCGIQIGSASNASLLGNFEIVATTVIALVIFKEQVSGKLWAAIGLITVSSMILSVEGNGSFQFSYGSLLVILATVCWGLENNCTRMLSQKSAYEIVVLKGIFSGGGSFIIALLRGEHLPGMRVIGYAMALGFVAYGLSIFLYVRAQSVLGAAKTSAYYAIAPFIGALLALLVNGEQLTPVFFAAFLVMAIGTVFVVSDTLVSHHCHGHVHTIVHTHDGSTHSHTYTHVHEHQHFAQSEKHAHVHHDDFMHSEEHRKAHETIG